MKKNSYVRPMFFVRIGLIVAAGLLIAYGAKSGGMGEVLNKARMICLECIGIG